MMSGMDVFQVLCNLLGYYEYLSEQLWQIKQVISSEIADSGNEVAEILKNKKKPLSWLKTQQFS